MWYAAGIQAFSAYGSPLIAMRTAGTAHHRRVGGEKRGIKCEFTPEARYCLDVIESAFLAWSGECPMAQNFGPTASWQQLGRIDASTQWGCGGFIFDGSSMYGFMHRWDKRERRLAKCKIRESSGVFEVLGAVYWLQLFGARCEAQRVQIEMDSDPGVMALEKAFSVKPAMLGCVSAARLLCADHYMCVRWRQVRGDVYNDIADHLSHGRWNAANALARSAFGLEGQLPRDDRSVERSAELVCHLFYVGWL